MRQWFISDVRKPFGDFISWFWFQQRKGGLMAVYEAEEGTNLKQLITKKLLSGTRIFPTFKVRGKQDKYSAGKNTDPVNVTYPVKSTKSRMNSRLSPFGLSSQVPSREGPLSWYRSTSCTSRSGLLSSFVPTRDDPTWNESSPPSSLTKYDADAHSSAIAERDQYSQLARGDIFDNHCTWIKFTMVCTDWRLFPEKGWKNGVSMSHVFNENFSKPWELTPIGSEVNRQNRSYHLRFCIFDIRLNLIETSKSTYDTY